jgi:hypothetical protein
MKKLIHKNMLKLVTLSIIMLSAASTLAQNQFGGLALYTVRDAMGVDAKATLSSVAEIGNA